MKKLHPSSVIAMVGGIIGAGIFGVPYVFSRSGVAIGVAYSILMAAVSVLLGIYYTVVASETPGKHRLIGYAKKNLGAKTTYFVGIVNLIEFFGALLVYIILGGTFLSAIFGGGLGVWTAVFFTVVSVVLLFPLQKSDVFDRVLTCGLVVVVVAIIVIIAPKVTATDLVTVNLHNWFMPYGVLLFAFGGSAIIPEVVELNRKKESGTFHAVVIGTLIAALITVLFGIVVVGVSGAGTTENALAGLAPYFGRPVVLLGSIFGVLAMATQFIISGSYVRDQFIYDFKFPRLAAWAVTIGLPLAAYGIGARDFVGIIGFLGATTGTITGLLIAVMAEKIMSKKKEFPSLRLFVFPLMLLFVAGLIAEITSFFK